MYSFDENGFLFSEKCIQFLKSYFERCVKVSATHEVTLVLFSRVFYPYITSEDELRKRLSAYYRKGDASIVDDDLD